jgi:hypothetical protein
MGFGRRSLEVLSEASASSKPVEGAFDDPAPWQELEAFDPSRALNDLDGPGPTMGERANELLSAINPVSKDMSQLWKDRNPLQQRDRTMDILNIGGAGETYADDDGTIA